MSWFDSWWVWLPTTGYGLFALVVFVFAFPILLGCVAALRVFVREGITSTRRAAYPFCRWWLSTTWYALRVLWTGDFSPRERATQPTEPEESEAATEPSPAIPPPTASPRQRWEPIVERWQQVLETARNQCNEVMLEDRPVIRAINGIDPPDVTVTVQVPAAEPESAPVPPPTVAPAPQPVSENDRRVLEGQQALSRTLPGWERQAARLVREAGAGPPEHLTPGQVIRAAQRMANLGVQGHPSTVMIRAAAVLTLDEFLMMFKPDLDKLRAEAEHAPSLVRDNAIQELRRMGVWDGRPGTSQTADGPRPSNEPRRRIVIGDEPT